MVNVTIYSIHGSVMGNRLIEFNIYLYIYNLYNTASVFLELAYVCFHRKTYSRNPQSHSSDSSFSSFNQIPTSQKGTDLTFDPTAASHSTLLQKNRTHPHIRPYPNKNTQPFQEKNNIPGSHLTLPHFTLPQTRHP